MRKYTSGGQLEAVVCNCCGKKLIVVDGIVREGVLSINHAWDFFSEKDGEIHHFDLCEPCYDAVISEFKLPVDVEEQKEFLSGRRNVNFLFNRVTDEKLAVDQGLYNSLMVQLLVGDPQDPRFSPYFKLVYDNVFARIYEVL